MTAHTPGPWVVTGEMDRLRGGEWIRPLDSEGQQQSELVAVVCDFNRDDRADERQANAQLIAAAPDLLAVVRDLVRLCDEAATSDELDEEFGTIGEPGPLVQRARSAIAKAEGRNR